MAAAHAWAVSEGERYQKWMNARWTQDDGPYKSIRDTLDHELVVSSNLPRILATQQLNLSKHPRDPRRVFAYYYALYHYDRKSTNIESGSKPNPIEGIYDIIASQSLQLPHTYNFARLAFLCQGQSAAQFGSSLGTNPLGWRLLSREPRDIDVLTEFIAILTYNYSPVSRNTAMQLAKRIVRIEPTNGDGYGMLGCVYAGNYVANRDALDRDKAIENYSKCLQMEPNNQSAQVRIGKAIKILRGQLPEY